MSEARIKKVEYRVDDLEARIAKVERRLDVLDSGVLKLRKEVDMLMKDVRPYRHQLSNRNCSYGNGCPRIDRVVTARYSL